MGNELVSSEGGGLLSVFHGKDGGLAMPKPFERDIFLFDTHVAGTSYFDGSDFEEDEILETLINVDDKLNFFREPDNSHDHGAIVIKTADGVKIGYVPKADNVIFARLMDAGKLLFAKVTYKKMKGDWLKVGIKVYLRE